LIKQKVLYFSGNLRTLTRIPFLPGKFKRGPEVAVRSTEVLPSKARPEKKDMATITFGLLREDRDRVTRVAKALGKSVSGVCREALALYLRQNPDA
jgi:hypothetical protein